MKSGMVFGATVNTVLGLPMSYVGEPGFKSWLHSQSHLPASVHPGRQKGMAQVFGSLPHTWEALASAWPRPSCYRHLGL